VNPETLAALEALLFASDAPLDLARLAEVLEIDMDEARVAVEALRAACETPGRGIALVEIAGGVRLVTRPELAAVLLRLQRLRLKSRLSRAALETLAIVAYRQPISRPEIEQLRGVGAESVLAHLLERRLVRVVGREKPVRVYELCGEKGSATISEDDVDRFGAALIAFTARRRARSHS